MKRKGKVILILVIVAVLLGAAAFGGWYFLQNRNSEPVAVFPFTYIGMTEYWGDSQESYGPITTDRIQTVFLSDTQTVTEILVQSGDTVKKGDLLMTFDTTLSDLALERERLGVEKLKLQLESANKELADIKNMKPMEEAPPPSEPEEDANLGMALSGDYQISQNILYDGSSQDKALICWVRDTAQLDDTMFAAIGAASAQYRAANPVEPAPTENPEETQPPRSEHRRRPGRPSGAPSETADTFFVVIKVTAGNMSLGAAQTWQGLEVSASQNGTYAFRLYDAGGFADHMLPQQDGPEFDIPEVEPDSGFTAAQIAQMRAEKEKQIKDLKFQIKMAEADYAIKQTEIETGQVIADVDGTVISLLTEEEAKLTMQPILKISGGGGFYMEGTISELEKDNLQIGQEVTVNDWNTGMQYIGTVQSVGDFPTTDNNYYGGMGNPNVSYYPFTVYIDGSADLQEGSYVNVVFSTATAQQGIYLENPFLRTEQGKSYVYVQGADGKLEKRFITVGKSLWGSYTEILSGITAEDLLAFPYGKTVHEGADTVESDLSVLYGY